MKTASAGRKLAVVALGAFLLIAGGALAFVLDTNASLWTTLEASSMYKTYQKQNPAEAARVKTYWLSGGAKPTVATKFGTFLVEVNEDRVGTQPPPPPPPTDTTTTTPPPPPPPPSGFPNATNTGVPAGSTLHSCATNITTAGTYDLCQFNGTVTIRAAGVKITRSLILGQVVAPNDNLQGATFTDVTIDCGCMSQSDTSTPVAIQYNNFTLTRVNLSHSGHGVALGSNVTIQDSYIHDLGGNTEAHKDGLYVGDGTNVLIKHNNIECNDGPKAGCTSAIGLLTDFGTVSNFVIDGNLLNTIGSYCFYAAGGPSKPYGSDHITFTNNHFGRKYRANCGFYGPVTYWNSSKPGMVWSGNVWDDTGQTVLPAN